MRDFVSALLRLWVGVMVGLFVFIVALAPAWLLVLAIAYFTTH